MADSPILDNIRDSFGKVVYTHKTHEKQLEILHFRLGVYRWVRFVLIAVTATGAIGVVVTNSRSAEVVTAILGVLSLLVTLYGMGYNPEKVIAGHRRAAKELWYVREQYLNLIADLVAKRVTADEAAQARDYLTKELARIYQDAPETSPMAYNEARKALKISEEMTFSDKEIDDFLPKGLKKSQLIC
jgi:hypothetical protein